MPAAKTTTPNATPAAADHSHLPRPPRGSVFMTACNPAATDDVDLAAGQAEKDRRSTGGTAGLCPMLGLAHEVPPSEHR